MEKPEWNKFFAWLIALFPQWKPDAVVSAAWFEQLESYAVAGLKAAVRSIRITTPSPFPPGIFEIIAVVESGLSNPELDAARAWQNARICARGSMSMAKAAEIDSRLPEAIRLVGGLDTIGMVTDEKRPFLERRFLEIYQSLSVEGLRHRVLTLQKYTGPEKIGAILPKLVEKAGQNEG